MMKTIAFILHGRLRRIPHLRDEIIQRFSAIRKIKIMETRRPGEAADLAAEAGKNGVDELIAVGGDGTLNEVLNGLMTLAPERRGAVKMGLIPRGTGNDFARTLGIKNTVEDLFRLVEKDRGLWIDAGELSYSNPDGKPEKRFFINIADLGIGGLVVRKTLSGGKLLGSRAAYVIAVLRSLMAFRPVELRIEGDAFSWAGKALSVCLANGRFFGGGMGIAPEADLSDERAEVVVLGRVGIWEYIRYLPQIFRGERIRHPEVHYGRVKSCLVHSPAGECPIEMDGEFVGSCPARLTMHKKVIRFFGERPLPW